MARLPCVLRPLVSPRTGFGVRNDGPRRASSLILGSTAVVVFVLLAARALTKLLAAG